MNNTSEENKEKNKEEDTEEEKEQLSYYEIQQKKTEDMIKNYNIGTLKMFISPEILSMTSKDRKKIEKIYYKREYTETPGDIIKKQKDEEMRENQEKQKLQAAAAATATPPGVAPAPPGVAPAPPVAGVAPPIAAAAPAPPLAPPPNIAEKIKPENPVNKNNVLRGGAFFDSEPDYNDLYRDRDRYGDRDRDRDRYGDRDRQREKERINAGTTGTSSTATGSESLIKRVSSDAEPFIASLVKFSNAGFPNNTTVKSRVDTFFNIGLFRAFLKRLGEPIKLYNPDNQLVSPSQIDALNIKKDDSKSGNKNKVYEEDNKTEGDFITIWYSSDEKKQIIGSVYAFIYYRPTEQEIKQQTELGKKIPQASVLMIKEGDNYKLIGGPIDNRVKTTFPGYSQTTVTSDQYNKYTSEGTVRREIESRYRTVTGQSSLPSSSSARNFIFEPNISQSQTEGSSGDTAKSPINELKTVIYSRQVSNSQMDSIIQSAKSTSTEVVKVPIPILFNIIKNKIQTGLQIKIELDDRMKKLLLFIFRILEKQNLLSTISSQRGKGKGEIYEDRDKNLKEKLSATSINVLNSTIIHNIRFILNILFSTKTAFKYRGIDYVIDYVEWNDIFKQLNKILDPYKIAYYIEIELFLEKLEKGKLPIDRDGTLFSSCAVKGAQLRNYWKKNFVEQNWSKVGKQLKQSFTISKKPSITDILPGFVKSALQIDGNQLMTPLGAGVNQISLVQYCFLGQEQLVNEFKSIDNSFAGVSWKNNNTWEKRKERLFAGMDICDSDIYCFQNVQCSLDSYKKIVSTLTPKEQETLQDINKIPQIQRINIHQDVITRLLEDIEDPLNLVAQIYQRYKDGYSFVYFFEQNYTEYEGNILVPDDTKTALGHLTMFKTNKFELRNQFDIRIAHFIRKKKDLFKSNNSDVFDPLFINKSFAVVTYLTFKGGNIKKPISLPEFTGTPVANTGSNVSARTTSPPRTLPGLASMPPEAVVIENDDDKVTEKDVPADTVEDMPDYIEEPAQQTAPQTAPQPAPQTGQQKEEVLKVLKGGDGSEIEWYNRDNNEQSGFFKQYMSSQAQSKTPSKKVEQVPCKKYMSDSYIPGDQMFGIINVKLETRETLKEIKKKEEQVSFQQKPQKKTNEGEQSKDKDVNTPETPTPINKQILQVLLTAGLIGKFRSRYIFNKSTDENPFFIVGDFNYNIPYDTKIARSNITTVYNQAPALALLLSRSNSSFINDTYAILGNYKELINKYIYSIYILTYLYGGERKNGRLRLIGYTNSETIDKMFGNTYPIDDKGQGVTKSQFIFATGKLSLCPKEEMNKIVNSGSSEGLPAFPNDINPSNSDAIGGVFSIDTAFVKRVETQVNIQISDKKSDSQQKQNDDMKREVIRSNFGYGPGSQGNEEDLADDQAQVQSQLSPSVDQVQPQIMPSSTPLPRVQVQGQRGPLSPAQSPAVRQDKPPAQRQEEPPAQQQEEPSAEQQEEPQVPPLSPLKVEQIKSAISAINKEAPNFEVSASGKSKENSTKLVPEVIDITGDKLDKLKKYEYTDSKEETIKQSPYKESVILCETGKPDYQYLTYTEMNDWQKEENKTKIYSDHAPVLYKVNNSTDKKCGTTQSGGMERMGYVEQVGQAGGAGPTQIDFVTWNIGMQGKQFQTEDESTKELKTTFTHKFKGGVEETDDIYKQRLINNASAIEAILKQEQGYDYMLLQEAPTTTETSDLFKTEIINKGLNFIQPSYKKDIDASKETPEDASKETPKDAPKEANVDEDTSGISQFCLVTKDDASDYTNSGIVSLSGKRVIYIGDIAESIYNSITRGNAKINLGGYTTIKKDFSHLWFFINEKKNLILVSVHFTLGNVKGEEPKMYERQEQLYTFLNAIVFAIRQMPTYQNFSILFSGDFNVNMLQPFPSDVEPTFLKCSSVPGQETVIYTSVNNAPSSFGGENEGKYNPTNIDFALFYPTPLTQLLEASTSSPPIISSKPSAASASPVVTGPISKVEKITLPVELEIFGNLPKNYWISGKGSKPTFNPLNRSVSIIGTDYSEAEGKSNKMPLGSATLLYIGNISLINVSYGSGAPPYPTMDNKTRKINYMIQASPGSSVGGGNGLTKTTLSNSVMNSLILATLHNVKEIIIPFIGGKLFVEQLTNSDPLYTKKKHADLLIKGVVDYYDYIKSNSNIRNNIEKIYFSAAGDEISALNEAIRDKKLNNTVSVIDIKKEELIKAAINNIKIDAIVNAANTELGLRFGTGISGMLFAGIGSNSQKQVDLDKTKELFIKAFNAYIQKQNTPSATSVSPATTTTILTSATLAPPKIGASVTTSLVTSPVLGSVVSGSPAPPVPAPSAKPPGSPGPSLAPVLDPSLKPSRPLPPLPTLLPGSAPSTKILAPAPTPALTRPPVRSGSKPLPSSISTGLNITRATVEDFVDAQTNGIKGGTQIPHNPRGHNFNINGVPYFNAVSEIFQGKKEGHWMWYVFPSDTPVSSTTAIFFRLGPEAQREAGTLGQTTISIQDYLQNKTLLENYVLIVGALYESMESEYKNSNGQKPYNKILFDIFQKLDYPKLQSSIQNFYTPLKERLFENSQKWERRPPPNYENDYIEPMKQMNKLNIILNGIEDTDPDINERSDDTLFTSSLMSSIRDPTLAPARPSAPTGLRGPPSDAVAATSLQKNQSQSQILSLNEILKFIINNMNKCMFVVNGGSFNPPHNGHIKMFDLAYGQLSTMQKNKTKKMYGIMVVAPDWWLDKKKLSPEKKISEQDRIKLCKLACDGYKWSDPANFNASNMIILDVANNDPINILIRYFNTPNVIEYIKKIYNYTHDIISLFIHNYLLYLCGSDLYIKIYSDKSDYSIIYVVRQEDEGEIRQKNIDIGSIDKNGKALRINDYLQMGINPSSKSLTDEYDLSSTKIRERIESLKTVKKDDDWETELVKIRTEIVSKIGLGVYCFLKSINYLVDGELYGNLCEEGSKEEVSKVREDIADVEGIELQKSFRPSKPGIKSVFSDIDNVNIFNKETDINRYYEYFEEMIDCNGDVKQSIDSGIYDRMYGIFTEYLNKGFYRFLNDLYYFKKKAKLNDPTKCVLRELFGDKNLLEGLINYDDDIQNKSFDRTKFMERFTENDKKYIEDILDFLYDSQRYSIYIYLISFNRGKLDDGRLLLIQCYGAVATNTITKMQNQFSTLTKTLKETLKETSGKIGAPVSGEMALLQAMNYTFQRSNGNGNCFYNSVGMLSSDYVKSKENFQFYHRKSYEQQNRIQFTEQSRVRTELTNFLINVYNIIRVIIGTDEVGRYYDNEIIRYILNNGYRNNFSYVSYIADSVGPAYYGTEVELKLSSLLYKQPIVAITAIRGVIGYELSNWDTYDINIDGGDIDFVEYVSSAGNKSKDAVLTFLNEKFSLEVYYQGYRDNRGDNMQVFREFLTQHPQTYFLIGGRGHWSYGINEGLLQPRGLTVGIAATGARTGAVEGRSSGVRGSSGRSNSGFLKGVGDVFGAIFSAGASADKKLLGNIKNNNKTKKVKDNKNTDKNTNKSYKKQSHIKVENKKTKKIVKNNKNSKKTRKNR